MVNLFHSRRINYKKCDYWIRDERTQTGPASQWVLYNTKSGSFYAHPITPKSNQANVVNGVWMVDKNNITLETEDNADNLSRGSIVKYNNELWLVESVQQKPYLKESEFSNREYYKYFIQITRS